MAVERNPVQWLNNFALGFAGQRPVFHNGVQIGYFRNADDLCKGVIQIYPQHKGNTKYSEWTTKDDWWRDIPVNAFCASVGLKPQWLSPSEYTQVQSSMPAVAAPSNPLTNVAQVIGKPNVLPYALAAGAGVVALVLLLRR